MFPVRLETERLIVREFLPSDLPEVDAYASDPEVVRYEVWGPNTNEDSERFLSSVVLPAQRAEPRTTYELAIEAKGIGLIGGCGMRIKDSASRTADLGYVLARAHWGKGYMPEAITALVDFGFTTLGLHRIWATTDTRNVRSNRVLERIGMRQEGHRKADQFRRGEWTSSYSYAILQAEWAARRQPGLRSLAVTVRPATGDDYAGIAELFVHIDDMHRAARPDLFRVVEESPRSSDYINELIRGDDTLLLVAEGSPGLVGAAVALLHTTEPNSVLAGRRFVLLDMLVTHPEHRRMGIGVSLVRAIERWARDREATALELSVHEFNADARKFYEKLGYVTMTRRLAKRLAADTLDPTP